VGAIWRLTSRALTGAGRIRISDEPDRNEYPPSRGDLSFGEPGERSPTPNHVWMTG